MHRSITSVASSGSFGDHTADDNTRRQNDAPLRRLAPLATQQGRLDDAAQLHATRARNAPRQALLRLCLGLDGAASVPAN